MWTRRIASGTQEHPAPKDVFKAVLERLIEKRVDSAWAHVEVIADTGWFQNLLHGKEPWIEVAFVDERSLQLNPGVPKSRRACMPALRWVQDGKGLWTVPVTDMTELIEWMDKCLIIVSENPDYQVSGWIDGL